MIVTQGNVAAIFKGYGVQFWAAYSGSAEPISERLMMNTPSTGLSEQHNWLNATAGIRELVDEAVLNDLSAQDYTIVNKEFEETLTLRQIEITGDRYGILSPRLQILGANARYHPDQLTAELLMKGLDGTGKDYTGTPFFAENKVAFEGATPFTNVTTGRLTAERYRAARANLKNRTNGKGRPLNLGRELKLIVSPTYEAKALEILTAERLANGATNVDRGTATVEVWPELTASGLEHAWFLVDYSAPMKPFIKQTLIPWTYYTVDNPQDNYVIRFHKFIFQIYGAYNIGYGFPETIYGSDGTVA